MAAKGNSQTILTSSQETVEQAFHVQWNLAREAHDREVSKLRQDNRRLSEQLSLWQRQWPEWETPPLTEGLLCVPANGKDGCLSRSSKGTNGMAELLPAWQSQGEYSESYPFVPLERTGEPVMPETKIHVLRALVRPASPKKYSLRGSAPVEPSGPHIILDQAPSRASSGQREGPRTPSSQAPFAAPSSEALHSSAPPEPTPEPMPRLSDAASTKAICRSSLDSTPSTKYSKSMSWADGMPESTDAPQTKNHDEGKAAEGEQKAKSQDEVKRPGSLQQPDKVVALPNACTKCGNVFMADALFCRKCGTRRAQEKREKSVRITVGHESVENIENNDEDGDDNRKSNGMAMVSVVSHRHVNENWEKIVGKQMKACSSHLSVLHPAWLAANNMDELFLEGNPRITRGPKSVLKTALSQKSSQNMSSDHNLKVPPFLNTFLTMKPGSRLRIWWDVLSMLLCGHDFITFPLQVTEIIKQSLYTDVMAWLLAVFWSADVLMSISTGYYVAEGTMEMRRTEIVKKYAKTWMGFDIPIIVIDWFLISIGDAGAGDASFARLSKVTRMVRMVRLLRIIKLCPKIWDMVGNLYSEAVMTLFQIFQYIVLIVLINHYIACALFATWDSLEAESDAYHYTMALHWALSHSTLGSMDVVPSNIFERCFSSVILVVSMVLFSTFLSSITNATQHLRALHAKRVREESMVRKYFADNKISKSLSGRVWSFIWQHDLMKGHRLRLDEVEVFSLLPSSLILQIKNEAFVPFLIMHPLFRRYNQWEPEAIQKLCSTAISQGVVRPSEEMFYGLNMAVHSMIFVINGLMEYLPKGELVESLPVKPGMWACEEILWAKDASLTGPLVGGPVGADILVVEPREFQEITRANAQCLRYLVSYAEAFVNAFNESSTDESCADLLFNDAFNIEYIAQRCQGTKHGGSHKTQIGVINSGQESMDCQDYVRFESSMTGKDEDEDDE